MKRTLLFLITLTFFLLVVLSTVILVVRFGSKPLSQLMGIKDRAGIRVESNVTANVLIDGKEAGQTPYQDEELLAGDHTVDLKAQQEGTGGAKLAWQGFVRLNKGTLSVVNRELGDTSANSSGEVITLEPGKGIAIVSKPDGSDIEMDGKYLGKTPLLLSEVGAGEHLFFVSHSNFLKRSIRANLIDGFKLNLSVDLAISEPDLTKISTTPIQSSVILIVKQTPTGFLRVRKDASISSDEVAQLKPGDKVILLEEIPSWYRIRTTDGKEGYISSAYASKQQ